MINRTVLVGRLTKDPEIRYSSNGVAVTSFAIAVNRTFSKEKEADFINCVCFKKTAENLANYQKKGNQIGVDGRIQTRSYENKEGKRVYVTEIVADQIAFLDSKNKDTAPAKEEPAIKDPFAKDGNPIDISDDDLPF